MGKMSKRTQKAVDAAKLHLAVGNQGAFARMLSAVHRAENTKQQTLIWDWLVEAGHEHLFERRNGAVVAKEDESK